ncbi:hypothetical protein ACVRXF_10325 [Streptococcus orisasini]|uniref:hypothetical protein n=1 Tax=Streptococcus orisasini TaxID=1080071 RepID=UPI000708A4DA|nr:hypothetical protein [Streptococcus orisasini]
MKYKTFIVSLGNFLCHLFILFLFVDLLLKTGILDKRLSALNELKSVITVSPQKLVFVISIVSNIVSAVVGYLLAKFLITLFIEDGEIFLFDILLSRTIMLMIDCFLLLIYPTSNLLSILKLTAFISIIIMFSINYHRNDSLKTALLAVSPFLFSSIAAFF